jgi:hypothetical protein
MKPHFTTFLSFIAVLMLTAGAASAANNPPDSGAAKARYCVTIDQVPEATTCAARCAAESWVCSDTSDVPSVVPDRAARCDQPNRAGAGPHVCLCCPPAGNGAQ